jgi:NAD(P)-dependent dehydrogenase (short-subunit alcohol dehydrogenase family)
VADRPVALVTGGNRGIGLAIAKRLDRDGYPVAVTYRASDPPAGLFSVKCDVTSGDDVERTFGEIAEHFGEPVGVLVSNAGVTRDGLLLRMSETDFTDVIDANLTAAFRVAKRASKDMLRARAGRIVFLSSVVGLLGSAGQANYAASKAGLVGFARSLARELGSRGKRGRSRTGRHRHDRVAQRQAHRRAHRGRAPRADGERRRDRRGGRVLGVGGRRLHHRRRDPGRRRPRHGALSVTVGAWHQP